MRVTDKMGFNQVISNLQKNRGEMSDLQNQAAIQKRITKPSDDPTGATRVLGYRTEEKSSQQFIKNISIAKSFLEFTDVSLGEVSDVLMRLKELAIQQSSDASSSAETRRTVAEEVAQTHAQMIQMANRKLGDRYVFGGFQTTTPPFDREGNYSGDDGEVKLHVNKDAFMPMNLTGDKVFIGKGMGDDSYVRPKRESPKTVEELEKFQMQENERVRHNEEMENQEVRVRGLASDDSRGEQAFKSEIHGDVEGVNILDTVKRLEIGLRTNDKTEIQESIDLVDKALAQVINARAQVGARLQVLSSTDSSLRQNIVDNKTTASQVEDADLFQVASDITKAESALKATLETSGKVVTPSLLDFIK
jgi:flagellar hook-associated protein 3 FlgL